MTDDNSGRQSVLQTYVGQIDGLQRMIEQDGADPDIIIPMLDNWKHGLASLLDDRYRSKRVNRAYRL